MKKKSTERKKKLIEKNSYIVAHRSLEHLRHWAWTVVLLTVGPVEELQAVERGCVSKYSMKGCQIFKKVSYLFLMTYVVFPKGRQLIISDSNSDIHREESDFQVNGMHFLETVKAISMSLLERQPENVFQAFFFFFSIFTNDSIYQLAISANSLCFVHREIC